MLIKEEILDGYRGESGILELKQLPESYFYGDTPLWLDTGEINGSYEDCRENLKIAVVFIFTHYVPKLKPGRQWAAFYHQCGGHACEHIRGLATPINLKPEAATTLLKIAKKWFYRYDGHFYRSHVSSDDKGEYCQDLAALNLKCEQTLSILTESVYPIDPTPDNFGALCNNVSEISDLCVVNAQIPAIIRGPRPVFDIPNASILFLAENSD